MSTYSDYSEKDMLSSLNVWDYFDFKALSQTAF